MPLEALVFTVGLSTLGAEIAATRLLAPFFGTSTVIWANTIAVVLLALAAGYKLGGVLGDRRPSMPALCTTVLVGSALLAVTPFIAHPFLSLSVSAFDEVSVGAFAASLFGTLVLVAVPLLLLGTVSPWATRIALASVEEAGAVSGRLYAISTIGSLIGVFFVALWAIEAIGSQRTFLVLAVLPAAVAAAGLSARAALVPLALVAAFFIPPGATKSADGARVLYETETPYQYARVVQQEDGDRLLELNEGQAIHSLWRADTVLTGGYWDGFLTMPFATGSGRPPARIAALGTAAGTVPRAYSKYYPETVIDAVDIDPELFKIGHRYFGLQARPQLREHTQDARPFLRQTERALRRDLRRRLPPALHPLLPDDEGVLRARAGSAEPRRVGDRQHRPPERLARARTGDERDDGGGLQARRARPDPLAELARDGVRHAAERVRDRDRARCPRTCRRSRRTTPGAWNPRCAAGASSPTTARRSSG